MDKITSEVGFRVNLPPTFPKWLLIMGALIRVWTIFGVRLANTIEVLKRMDSRSDT